MTTNLDIIALSREFCRLTGLIWYDPPEEQCGDPDCLDCYPINPDFSDAREVIRVMEAREDFLEFITKICHLSTDGVSYDVQYDIKTFACYVLNTTGLMLNEAVEFMRRNHDQSV